MPNYESNFIAKGFKILQRCTLEKAPANLRDRADAVVKALNVSPEQCVSAVALCKRDEFQALNTPQAKPITPILLLIPAAVRRDSAVSATAKALEYELSLYPLELIGQVFGAAPEALTPLAKINANDA